ncbi:hypothetical protein JCM10207_006851 [Rhodosporidiobolus poonsookiae]
MPGQAHAQAKHPGLEGGSDVAQVLTARRSTDLDVERHQRPVAAEGEGALKVRFNWLSMMLFCFTVTATPVAWAGTFATAIYSGGPVSMFFGFLIVWLGSIAGATSLAEMVSIWPSSEGQILWASKLAPRSCERFVRYYTACIAWIFMTCSATFICALGITAIASFCHPSYEPQNWHTVLIFWAVSLYAFLFNVFGFRLFGLLNTVTSTITVCITVVVVVVLLSMHEGEYNSGKYAFTEFINGTGWENNGIVFILGMVGGAYSILGYESVAHMSEELHEPERAAPKAMIGSVLMSLPTGVLIILAVCFTISDLDTLAAQMFPILNIIYNACRSVAGSVIIVFLLSTVSSSSAAVSILATSGRVSWSFALEGGLPFSNFFAHISPRFNVPVRALAASTIIQCLLVLIYIGNGALFNSILVLAIALLNSSYAIPIALMLFRARPSGMLPNAPFRLRGVLGPLANAVALAYEIFISFFLFFPNVRPVTGSNMNYACAILGVAHVFIGVYWFVGGKHRIHRATHHEGEVNSQAPTEK